MYCEVRAWTQNDITWALERAWECSVAGNCRSDTGTVYPHPWVNTGSLKWTCGQAVAANMVAEFPILTNDSEYDGGPPGTYRVFYSTSVTATLNPPGVSTAIVYCGIAGHRAVGTGFSRCNGPTVAAAAATPTAINDL